MRNKFDEQLKLLNEELNEMGALCESAIANSAKALLTGDKSLAEHAISIDSEIDQQEREIESLCLKLLLQQQPVARDLRQISSALKMITDMERIGDQAADIAEIISLANLKASNKTMHIGEMAKATIKMVMDSVDAFVKRDLDAAQAVVAYDDVVDQLFDTVKNAPQKSISGCIFICSDSTVRKGKLVLFFAVYPDRQKTEGHSCR